MKSEIPKFLEVRGCINCTVSKDYKERHGVEYGFDHELMFSCLGGCFEYGFDISRPYFDPEEVLRFAKKNSGKATRGHLVYLNMLRNRFGETFKKQDIPIDKVISEFESLLQ